MANEPWTAADGGHTRPDATANVTTAAASARSEAGAPVKIAAFERIAALPVRRGARAAHAPPIAAEGSSPRHPSRHTMFSFFKRFKGGKAADTAPDTPAAEAPSPQPGDVPATAPVAPATPAVAATPTLAEGRHG
ncbi:hypothetical protein C0Z19_07315 [Trinickia soli]|uniref:Uncharacterized protein n=1 Tax=Trinickia soli TaxID=380675 RepID=A0A2N7WBG0_9BURK|nr:hypothetical protein C0Z19_07315 [Trinickia soli]